MIQRLSTFGVNHDEGNREQIEVSRHCNDQLVGFDRRVEVGLNFCHSIGTGNVARVAKRGMTPFLNIVGS